LCAFAINEEGADKLHRIQPSSAANEQEMNARAMGIICITYVLFTFMKQIVIRGVARSKNVGSTVDTHGERKPITGGLGGRAPSGPNQVSGAKSPEAENL